jgi:hypothetical protein
MDNEATGGLAAAGLYPDPRRVHELRYWDGAVWTDHVADGGATSVDDTDALKTGSEPVLLTLHKATEVRMGGGGDPLVNVHLTDRRLLFEYLTSRNAGAIALGGLIGLSIGGNADRMQAEGTGGQARTADEILGSPNEVRTVDYADSQEDASQEEGRQGQRIHNQLDSQHRERLEVRDRQVQS